MFFFFNDTATTEIYTLSLHDALPILVVSIKDVTHRYGRVVALDGISLDIPSGVMVGIVGPDGVGKSTLMALVADRKSTRLNSSHQIISYAVFCLKKKIKSKEAHTTH